jgi:hypothetical protein
MRHPKDMGKLEMETLLTALRLATHDELGI